MTDEEMKAIAETMVAMGMDEIDAIAFIEDGIKAAKIHGYVYYDHVNKRWVRKTVTH